MAIEKILIVEDDTYFAALLKEKLLLQKSIKEVDIIESGVEFFKHFMLKDYSMVILDYVLKDIDGLQILIEIQSKEIDLPVVIITGAGDESVCVDCFLNGAIDYIIKDFQTIDGVIARLEASIQRFKERQLVKAELEALRQETEIALRARRQIGDLQPVGEHVIAVEAQQRVAVEEQR